MSPPGGAWLVHRAELLAEMASVVDERRRAEDAGAGFDELRPILDRLLGLRKYYVDDLPATPVARHPSDGSVVTAAIDSAGLDGPFWDAQNPARPAEIMPPGFVVYSGSMRLVPDGLEHTPYLCLPGPPAPFVVPDLLEREGVQAVLVTVAVGAHTGYIVSYFSSGRSEPPPLPNEWGRREYWLRTEGRPVHMATSSDGWPAPDFELTPWIDGGKLAWVAPGDTTLSLERRSRGCPYLELRGDHRFQRVQLGQIF
jgi:hypothetical protein